MFKTTEYFNYTRNRTDRKIIKDEWILLTISEPPRTEIQTDGRIRKWRKINEVEKVLRVVLLEDGETIHNAFFDRNFKDNQ